MHRIKGLAMPQISTSLPVGSKCAAPRLLKTPDAAAYTGLSISSLTKFRCAGKGPRFLRVGGLVMYRPQDLDDWLTAVVVETEDSRRQQVRA